MKKLLLAFALSAFFLQALHAQFITGFGTGDLTLVDSSFGTSSQTASSYSISGSGLTGYFSGTITPLVLSGGITQLSLTGTLGSSYNTSFDLYLQDSNDGYLMFSGNWSVFSAGSAQSALLSLSDSYGFNGTVSKLTLFSNLSVSEPLSFTFDALSAVPEPTALLLLGMGLAGIAMRRSLRRR